MTPDVTQRREKNLLPAYLKNGDVYLRTSEFYCQTFANQFHIFSMATRQNIELFELFVLKYSRI